jgi:dihydrofolate reductase
MRRLRVASFLSLDGVMQAPGAPEEDRSGGFALGGWTAPYDDPAINEVIGGLFEQPFDLLLGRKTYEIFAAYWPFMPDNPIGARFTCVTKYVATRADALPIPWENSVRLEGDAARAIARLKQEEGPDLLVHGSANLGQTLLAGGLIDELILLTYPVLLGGGKRLFAEGTRPGAFALTESRVSAGGVVIGRYRPAGPVETGSFGELPELNAHERARRARFARDG